jgi:hypothetical protein
MDIELAATQSIIAITSHIYIYIYIYITINYLTRSLY